MDLALDPTTGDLLVDGGLQTVTGIDEIAQRITIGLTINLNEFFTHTNYGLPWLKSEDDTSSIQYFLGDKGATVGYIVSSIDKFILTIDDVDSVESSYDFDNNTRSLTYIPKITISSGESFTFPPYVVEI